MDTKPNEKVLKSQFYSPVCMNRCTEENPCKHSGRCVNVFTKVICDCFGTGYDGAKCTKKSNTINLASKDFIEWRIPDRRSVTMTKLRIRFKTARENGLMFYTTRRGMTIAAELLNGRLRVATKGDTEQSTTFPKVLIDTKWHTLELTHNSDNSVRVVVDNEYPQRVPPPSQVSTSSRTKRQQPPVYFGGINQPEVTRGVKSKHNFVGCMQQLQYNMENVIYKITQKINSRIVKHGRIAMGCPYNESNILTPKTTTILHTTPAPPKTLIPYKQQESSNNEHRWTSTTGLGETVIVWITAAIVIGTILIMISAACVVHHLRLRHHRDQKRRNQQPKTKAPLVGIDDADDNDNNSSKGSVKSIIETVLSSTSPKKDRTPTKKDRAPTIKDRAKDSKKDDKCRETEPLTKTEKEV